MDAVKNSDAAQPTRYAWYVIFVLTVVNAFNYMDRMALAVLLPLIKADLVLTDGQLGLLVGLAFSVFYAICGIPVARWADRGVRSDIIAIALAVWSLMTALSGAAQHFWHLFLARVGVGAGESGCIPPAQSLICDYVPLERRSGAFAVHSAGLFAGMLLGMALAGWLGDQLGWRWTFVALGVPGIAVALIVKLTLREPVRGTLDAVKDTAGALSFVQTARMLWSCSTYRRLMVFLIAFGFAQFGLYQWWPSFYARVFSLSSSELGIYLGMALGIGSAAGLLIGGWAANRVARRDPRLPLMVGAMGMLAALPLLLVSLFASSITYSISLVFLAVLLWSASLGPAVAALHNVTLPRARATASALSIFFQSVLGAGLGPFCVGLLSDALAAQFGTLALRYALLVPVCVLPVAIIALYAAARTLPGDLKSVSARMAHEPAATEPACAVAAK